MAERRAQELVATEIRRDQRALRVLASRHRRRSAGSVRSPARRPAARAAGLPRGRLRGWPRAHPHARTAGRLVGIDISAAQIERARAAAPEARFIHGDIAETSFAPESFDAIVALYVLTHIPLAELPPVLERVAEWLRPRGLLLATFAGGDSHEGVVDDWLGVPMLLAGHGERTNEQLVREAGLEILVSQLESMWEPESEPGQGPASVAFHWLLAEKPA